MKTLKDKILSEGKVINSTTVKVDSFLNHQMDPSLIFEIGKELGKKFDGMGVSKIITIESSGIAIAIMVGLALNVPVLFAKKTKPSTMDNCFSTKVVSFTKNREHEVFISKEFLGSHDKVLIIDDFLATGNAVTGMLDLISQARSTVIGVGIVIEKGFNDGGKILRDKGIRLESLAIIDIENSSVVFKENEEQL